MPYTQFKTANDAVAQLDGPINGTAVTMIVKTGQGARFPAVFPFRLTLRQYDIITGAVLKREIVEVTNRVGDTFTIIRHAESVRISDTVDIATLTSSSFLADDYVSLDITGGIYDALRTGINDANTDIATVNATKLSIAEYQNGTKINQSTSTGTDAYAISLTPPITAYNSTQTFRFKADVANTGTATLNVDGLGAKTIKKQHDVDLSTGDIEVGQIVTVSYDGTNFQMDSQVATFAQLDIDGMTEDTDPDGDQYEPSSKGGVQKKIKVLPLFAQDIPAGEVLSAGNCVFLPSNTLQTISQPSQNTVIYVGYDNSYTKQSQSFTTTASMRSIKSISLSMYKNGSPTGTLTAKVYSGQGTGLIATSQNTISEASLSTGAGIMSTFTFNNEVLLPNTLYYITIETTRANSSSNYVSLQKSSANQYASGSNFYVTNTGVYNDTSSDLLFSIICGDGTPGSVIKTTSGSSFLGFAKKAVASIPNNTNVVVAGMLVNMGFGNETTAITSTNDINQTSTANGVLQTIYSGASSQLNGFLSGPRVDNLEKITVYVTQQGTGGGVLTCSVYKWVADYYGPTLQKGEFIGSVAITSPTNGDNVFTFASPLDIDPNTWYIVEFTGASGNVSNYWGLHYTGSGNSSLEPFSRMLTSNSSGTTQIMGLALRMTTTYTLQRNYQKGDLLNLSDTPGALDTWRGGATYVRPVGKILDSNRAIIGKPEGDAYIGTASLTTSSAGIYQGAIPIPRNCTKVRIEVTTASNPEKIVRDFNISEFDGTERTILTYMTSSVTFTFNMQKNYFMVKNSAYGITVNAYFYQ